MRLDGKEDAPSPGKVKRMCFESSSDVCSPQSIESTDMKTECLIYSGAFFANGYPCFSLLKNDAVILNERIKWYF